jgi:hypothetical protein
MIPDTFVRVMKTQPRTKMEALKSDRRKMVAK